MSSKINRRNFFRKSFVATTGAALAFHFEEKALLAAMRNPGAYDKPNVGKGLPKGKLGDLEVSRVICGGNLISGFAHSRDLIYVSEFMRHYFTDEKVMETLQICEENGVNTAILRLDDHTLRIINKYWHERGGKIQWIAQIKIREKDVKSEVQRAIDNGASAVFVHGGVADRLVRQNKIETLARAVQFIKFNEVPAGIAGHAVQVPMACEKDGIDPDFYMKTINSKSYWSAGPRPRHDSVWAETPEQTIRFMENVKKPWIGYKVLGAGAIHPEEGFKYAFENGTDFICVGMFDFQVAEDAAIARKILAGKLERKREWMGGEVKSEE